MVCLRPGLWDLVLLDMLLVYTFPMAVQGVDPVSQKLRRLTEQFQQFQALTQARLHMLTLNQNRRNSSEGLESRVQALNERWQQTSEDLKDLQQSTKQEIGGLREWSRKLEKKSKRMEGRLALMERNLRESRRYAQKHNTDPDPDLSNLTLELQSQEERLAALQDQRDELLVGLRGLQESLKNQVLRVSRLEGRLREALQVNGEEHQTYQDPHRTGLTHRGGRPERVLERLTQPRPEGVPNPQTNERSESTAGSRNSSPPRQYQGTPNQTRHPKTQKPRPQLEPYPQVQHPPPEAESTDYLPHLDPHDPQSQIRVRASTRSYPSHQEQSEPDPLPQIHPTRSQPRFYHQRLGSWIQRESGPKPREDRLSRTGSGLQRVLSSDLHPHPLPETSHPGLSERENDTDVESSVIHGLLQIPARQKIPARPLPKKDATVCNVDSMLFFPAASAENYVTFSLTLPDLHELSVCLWLRVEAQHVGTLLSYATDENDNQIVLYGRSSSASSSSSSHSVDFVIGDPAYRRLPVRSLLDARWHHLCVLWSSIQGRFWHYTDRHLSSSGSNFRKGWEVPGGGSVVLGQEQDAVGGGFDPAEGFAGQVAGFRMWNRVLSPAEVEGVAEGRGVPRGVVLGMEDIKELHGEVQQVSCECLEHC